jgi:TonB family protein
MVPVASQPGAYSVVLSAGSQRSVWGSIVAKTTAGWYWMPFNNLQLTSNTEQYSTDLSQFQRFEFLSPTLYVRFPGNVRVLSAYVNSGRAEGDAEYGWLEKGLVSCQSSEDRRVLVAGAPSTQTVLDIAALKAPRAMPTAIPPGAKLLTPKRGESPGPTNCTAPFADASIARLEEAPYPINVRGRNGRVIVAVAIDSTGKLLDAWTWGSSGVRAFDAVAVQAARNTIFTPKRAFCQNVPSVNYLNTEFHIP